MSNQYQKIKIIKRVVIIMTTLLVIGLGFLVYGIAIGIGDSDKNTPNLPERVTIKPPMSDIEQVKAVANFKDIDLQEPVGSSIESIHSEGRYLYLTVKDGGVSDRVIIADISTGKIIGRIFLGER